MKVVVFGSTGGTGVATLRALLEAGHEVTAFARNPARLAGMASIRRCMVMCLMRRRSAAPLQTGTW